MKGKKCQKKMTQLLSLTEAISVFEGRHTERVNERALAYVRASTRVRSFACAQACAGVGGFLYANVRESVRRQDDITHTYPLSSSHEKKTRKGMDALSAWEWAARHAWLSWISYMPYLRARACSNSPGQKVCRSSPE